MGTVTILESTTKNPISLMGERAGVCWGANIDDKEKNYKRGLDCIKSGHGRVMEYVNVETVIDGYSARVIREWYTHLGGDPTRLQSSTRYIDYQSKGFEYIIPESIGKDPMARLEYIRTMGVINEASKRLLELDIPREDVAMMLPLGMSTKIVDKRNMRNIMDMSRQRLCSRAYWEYRKLMNDYLKALAEYSEEWNYLINDYKLFVPKCEALGYCPETRSCGRKAKLEQ